MNMEMNQHMGGMCKCPHHKVNGWVVMAFGLTYLLGTYNILSALAVSTIWAILIIIAGAGMLCKCWNKHGMCKDGMCDDKMKM